MHITRRITLASIPVLALAACAKSVSTTPSQIATDVDLIDSGLQSVVVALQAVPGVPPAALAKVMNYMALLDSDAKLVAASLADVPTSTVQDITDLVAKIAETVLPTLSFVSNGAAIAAVIQAARALVPILLMAVKAPVPASATMRVSMTPDAARLKLAHGV